MRRPLAILVILAITYSIHLGVNGSIKEFILGLDLLNGQFNVGNMSVILVGVLVAAFYTFKYGQFYTLQSKAELVRARKGPEISMARLFVIINNSVSFCWLLIWPYVKHTRLGRYLESIYEPPVNSEQVLGGFFFAKTILTTIVAFYYVDLPTLFGILTFSAIFDSLTGTYQHTLMNFFHKTFLESKLLSNLQNYGKRFVIDVFRAEIITLFLVGFELLSLFHQNHIFMNRLVSSSYYFNAMIIDRLVALNLMGRNFRSKFVIFASTVGGLISLIDLAHTRFPNWVPQEFIHAIPSWVPSPLGILAIFNTSVFVCAGGIYFYHFLRTRPRLKISQIFMPIFQIMRSRS